MNIRARIGQGALSLASLTGLRPQARTPAPAAELDGGPTAEEIAQRDANDAALRTAALAGVQPTAEADPPAARDGEGEDPPVDPMDDLRRRVEDLENRMPAEDCSAAAAAVIADRARCTAIFSDPVALAQPALAAELAFGTDLAVEAALAQLRAAAKAAPSALDARMASAPAAIVPPSQPEKTPSQAIASSWDSAFAAVRRR